MDDQARTVVSVIGVADDRLDTLPPEARDALRDAEVIAGGKRHLRLWRDWARGATRGSIQVPEELEVDAGIDDLVAAVHERAVASSKRVCVLASGDPGFFGIERALLRVIDRRSLRVLPAPSSVALAFARLGLPWDDAVVISAHGRLLEDAASLACTVPKSAVLTSPESPPESLGKALVAARARMDLVAVCSRLGGRDEDVIELSLDQLASGRFEPLSVVVLLGPGGLPRVRGEPGEPPRAAPRGDDRVLAWGLPDAAFSHRGGMITKSEVRSVVLGKLALPVAGVLWDVGAGSGSVAIEAALVRPELTVFAIEASAAEAARVSANAVGLGAAVHVVTGHAPSALEGLPSPDRVFVGGGGLAVLPAVLERLRPGGRVVATYAAVDRAVAAADALGHLVQVGIDTGERLPGGSWRFSARNPVFVVWGPTDDAKDTVS